MDLRQLRYFLEIVEQGSMTRAAARLNVAQPALSMHLRNMEKDLGTGLLVRSKTGVQCTEAGLVLARHARFLIAEQAKVEDEIRHIGAEPSGAVRLGLPGTISDILTVPLIEAARARYPGIRLTISEAMSGFVGDWLREGHIDLAVLYARPSDPGVESLRLLDEELVLISPPETPARGGDGFGPLTRGPLILPSKAHGLRQMLDLAAEAQGYRLEAVIEVDSYKAIKALVARGQGQSVLPLHSVVAEQAAGLLRVEPLSPAILRTVYLVNRGATAMTRTIHVMHMLLGEVVADLIRDGNWAGARRL